MFDLYLMPHLLIYKTFYSAVPGWFFITCLILIFVNLALYLLSLYVLCFSPFIVKSLGPWAVRRNFSGSLAGITALQGRADCKTHNLLLLHLPWPSLFFWLWSLPFSVESQQRGKYQRTGSPLGGR